MKLNLKKTLLNVTHHYEIYYCHQIYTNFKIFQLIGPSALFFLKNLFPFSILKEFGIEKVD